MLIIYLELLLLITAALISDIRSYKIKNEITAFFVFTGLITNLILNGWEGVIQSVLAAALPALLLIILFVLRMLGAGDIKLFCAIGAIAGVNFVVNCMAYSFIAGGIIAIAIMIIYKNFRQRGKYFFNYIKTCFLTFSLPQYTDFSNKSDNGKFRFAYAIACGTIIEIISKILD